MTLPSIEGWVGDYFYFYTWPIEQYHVMCAYQAVSLWVYRTR